MITLPESFITKIKEQLGKEAEAFLASYQDQRTYALRLNPLKVQHLERSDWFPAELQPLSPVPWCNGGYYYDESARPGLHPYHEAGVYYIQEPSAMSAVEELDPQPGEAILDLSAAPGGKATQIAGKMRGYGLLIANEIHPVRAKILAQNIERMGVTNAIVTNAAPDQLAARFSACFDRVLVDAPCSGEGMFRKDPEAIAQWSPEQVRVCAARQQDILPHAIHMLRPGGYLAYSTCTFSLEENEHMIEWLLRQYPMLTMIKSERIWPHIHKGEGHYVAILQKSAREGSYSAAANRNIRERQYATARSRRKEWFSQSAAENAMKLFEQWSKSGFSGFRLTEGIPLMMGEQLYWLPQHRDVITSSEQIAGLKIVRPGLHLGTVRKSRIEPAHALAMTAAAMKVDSIFKLSPDDERVASYLRGEEIGVDAALAGSLARWTLVAVDHFPIGWGKVVNGKLKNHYPKGLRRVH